MTEIRNKLKEIYKSKDCAVANNLIESRAQSQGVISEGKCQVLAGSNALKSDDGDLF